MIQPLIEGLEHLGAWCFSQALRLRGWRMRSGDVRHHREDERGSVRLAGVITMWRLGAALHDKQVSPATVVAGQRGEA